MLYLLYGIIMGIAIGTTVGPVAILCVHRSMAQGMWSAFSIGIGATIAHLIFAGIALFGMHFIQPFFDAYGHWIQLIGSGIILSIALHIARFAKREKKIDQSPINHTATILTSLAITLSGPLSIASYATFIGILRLKINTVLQASWFLSGIALGNFAWWILLSIASSYLYRFLQSKYVRYIDLGAAVMLAILGLFGIAISLYQIMQ